MTVQTRISMREQGAKQRLLQVMALLMVGGGVLVATVALILWLAGPGSLLDVGGAGGIALLGLLIYLLNRGGYHQAASLALAIPLVLVPTYYVLLEGPKANAILLFAGGVVYTEFFLGGRSGFIAAVVECVLYAGAGLVYLQGWTQSLAYGSSFAGDVVTLVLVCFALALTAGYFTRDLKRTLLAAQERARDLHAADEERDRLVAEIRVREEGLRLLLERVHELGSPIIPLGEGIIAMPIIGIIDAQRAEEVTNALLRGVEGHRARVAIIDVTGVPVGDASLGTMLLQMAQGVRLLGAEPVLTGVAPAMADVFVNLGLDFSLLTSQATLQEGLDYALGTAQR